MAAGGFGGEAGAEFAIGGDAAGDQDGAGSEGLGGGEGLADEVADYGGLKGGYEVEGLRVAEGKGFCWLEVRGVEECGAAGFDSCGHGVGLDVAEDAGLDAAEGEVEAGGVRGRFVAGADGAEVEGGGRGVAVGGEGVEPRAAGIAEAEELGYFVEGFSGGVVDGAAYVAVAPGAGRGGVGEVEVGVAAGDYEGEEGGLLGGFGVHEDSVDVAF